jgi:hypothetical protein
MKARFQKLRQKKGKNFDPLVHEDFNSDKEWVDSLHVVLEGGRECDLTWDLVDNAIGASEALRGRNLPRRAHNVYSRRNSVAAQNKPEAEEEDEDEVNVPHEDAEITDCEDEPNGGNDGGEGEAPNIP